MSDSNTAQTTSLSKRQKSILLLHGFITIIIGFMGGFVWLISMAGYLEIWPLPPIDFSIPDTKELYRNAHTGPITNGMLVILVVAISPLLRLTPKAAKFLTYGAIAMLWGNTIGYSTSPYTTNRGLTASGPFIDLLCYGSFYIAVFAAFTLVGCSIYGAYQTLLETKE